MHELYRLFRQKAGPLPRIRLCKSFQFRFDQGKTKISGFAACYFRAFDFLCCLGNRKINYPTVSLNLFISNKTNGGILAQDRAKALGSDKLSLTMIFLCKSIGFLYLKNEVGALLTISYLYFQTRRQAVRRDDSICMCLLS